MSPRDLFPEIEADNTGALRLDGRHTMYWETAGNPEGIPVVFLHGGPGAGCSADHRRFFDPAAFRVVLFDQRGCGRSTPHADLTDNTTQHLIADMERLREHLGIDKWVVFGGSWGSTLALAYAQAHPEACRALVVRGIFLARQQEIDWFLFGMGQFFPEEYARFLELLEPAERGAPLTAYLERLTDPDPAVHLPAARAWSTYEGACSTLLPSPRTVAAFGEDKLALSLARLEAHYFSNGCFVEENELLNRISEIRHLPAAIVQGRYDVICPPGTAHTLHRAWPEAHMTMVSDAGHSAMEPGIRRALVTAMESLKHRV